MKKALVVAVSLVVMAFAATGAQEPLTGRAQSNFTQNGNFIVEPHDSSDELQLGAGQPDGEFTVYRISAGKNWNCRMVIDPKGSENIAGYICTKGTK